MALTLDEPATPQVHAEIESLSDVYHTHLLKL
jgi:hypothetical protein